jgi:hypothetical protein
VLPPISLKALIWLRERLAVLLRATRVAPSSDTFCVRRFPRIMKKTVLQVRFLLGGRDLGRQWWGRPHYCCHPPPSAL